MFSLENHFSNKYYDYLDHYTKRIYIEYIKELSVLMIGKVWDGYFPLYLLKTQEINAKMQNWHWDKKIGMDAVASFLETIDPDFYLYIN